MATDGLGVDLEPPTGLDGRDGTFGLPSRDRGIRADTEHPEKHHSPPPFLATTIG